MEGRKRGRPPKPAERWGREAPAAREVRELRARLGWSRDRMAAELGTTFSTVFRWETGRQEPRGENLERLRTLAREHEGQGTAQRA